jgi:hypothetical protein
MLEPSGPHEHSGGQHLKRRQLILGLAGLAVAAPHVSTRAQSGEIDPVVQKPDVRQGDRWTYFAMDYWTNLLVQAFSVEVTHVRGDAIIGIIHKGNGAPVDAAWSSAWNATQNADGAIYTPYEELLRFPMRVGATYTAAWDTDLEKGWGRLKGLYVFSGHHERTVSVKGWEDVVVPGGKFRTLRIESEGSYRTSALGTGFTAKEVIWYAPEVNRFVKRVNEASSSGGAKVRWDGEELLRYEPAPR